MLKLINPDTSPESQELYLYWIRSEGMKDMSSEGYIGVTTNVKNRFGGHDLRLRSGSTDISEHFVQAYRNEDFLIMEVINAGSRGVIEIEEHALRPEPNIGWNIKVGGNGSGYAEKLYSQKLVSSFRRLIRQSGGFVLDLEKELKRMSEAYNIPEKEVVSWWRSAVRQMFSNSVFYRKYIEDMSRMRTLAV